MKFLDKYVSTGILFKMQNFRCSPRPTKSESTIQQIYYRFSMFFSIGERDKIKE